MAVWSAICIKLVKNLNMCNLISLCLHNQSKRHQPDYIQSQKVRKNVVPQISFLFSSPSSSQRLVSLIPYGHSITGTNLRQTHGSWNYHSTSFTSTNVKLRWRFDVHLTFHWHWPEAHLTTWPSSDLPLTLSRTLPNLDEEILNFTWNSLKLHLTLTWSSPDVYLTFKPSSDLSLTLS